jgi:hypothetical protein
MSVHTDISSLLRTSGLSQSPDRERPLRKKETKTARNADEKKVGRNYADRISTRLSCVGLEVESTAP